MQFNTIVVLDFETTSSRKSDTEICQVAALAVNPRNLKPIPGAEFESLMRPLEWDKVQDAALAVNHKTREELAEAPHPEEVWHKFARWVAQYNRGGKGDAWSAPIAAGHNILHFDIPIYERYCLKYGTTRTEKNGEVVPSIFGNFIRYDSMQLLGYWTENLPTPGRLSLDYLRKFMRMPQGDRLAHDALQDVRDTAAILCKLLQLSRNVSRKVQFEGCFDEGYLASVQAKKDEQAEKKAAKAEEKANSKRNKSYASD